MASAVAIDSPDCYSLGGHSPLPLLRARRPSIKQTNPGDLGPLPVLYSSSILIRVADARAT